MWAENHLSDVEPKPIKSYEEWVKQSRCLLLAWCLVPLFGGCSCDDEAVEGPCDSLAAAPDGCGDACTVDTDCSAGLHCGGMVCTADCVTNEGCTSAAVCTSEGRCAQVQADGGLLRDSSTQCGDIDVVLTEATPNVMLLVDRSGTMERDLSGNWSFDADYAPPTLWDEVKASLLDPTDGLIPLLESRVRFGFAMYTSVTKADDNTTIEGECPLLGEATGELIDPALNNLATIQGVYGPAELLGRRNPGDMWPRGDTPTGDAIEALVDRIVAQTDRDPNPYVFLVATDGVPDSCAVPNPSGEAAKQSSVAAVERAHAMGIDTYMLWIGDDAAREHMQDMANAGLGLSDTDPDAEFWEAGNTATLQTALTDIVQGTISCEVSINGELVLEEACSGSVSLNGRALTCDDANGWRATTTTTIELVGDACVEFKDTPGASLEGSFPCDVVTVI